MQILDKHTSCRYGLNAIYMRSVLQKYFKTSAAITAALGSFKSHYLHHGQYHVQLNAVPALLYYLVIQWITSPTASLWFHNKKP